MLQMCCVCKNPYEADKNRGRCVECRREYDRQRYNQDKGIGRTAAKEKFYKRQRVANEAKNKPCADCGIEYPYWVMDFDHRPGTAKVVNVARMVASGSMERLLQEIAKCDVVCANCHRTRTHQRGYHGTIQKI